MRRGGRGEEDRASKNEVGTARRRERRRKESTCENGRAATFSPAGSDRPVIYRPEPSPSLTPLLRNYTQSVANKSKKVSAALVPIHETKRSFASLLCLAPSPRRFRPVLARDPALRVLPPSPRLALLPYARSVRTFAVNPIEILVQIARAPSPYAPYVASLRLEIARALRVTDRALPVRRTDFRTDFRITLARFSCMRRIRVEICSSLEKAQKRLQI